MQGNKSVLLQICQTATNFLCAEAKLCTEGDADSEKANRCDFGRVRNWPIPLFWWILEIPGRHHL